MTVKQGLVSIIIAVRNNADTLDECIKSLLGQTYRKTEIIVVNDGSTDSSGEIAKKYPVKFINIRHTVYGCSRPRRIGIGQASGEFILIVDADARYHRKYIENMIVHFDDPSIGGAVGKVIFWGTDTWITKCRDVIYRVRYNNMATTEAEIMAGKIAAWFIRKRAYDRAGGHDRSIPHIGEDVDVTRRILKAGYRVVYEPKAYWWHRFPFTTAQFVRRAFNYGKSSMPFYRKYRDELDRKRFLFTLLPLWIAPFHLLLAALSTPEAHLFTAAFVAAYILTFVAQTIRWYRKTAGYPDRKYLAYYPLIGILGSFSNSLGILYGMARRSQP